ncbi:KH domain-containing protein 3 [Microcebus murinus]|uniref:KH domain-containing protein 3 n=1 Tax=Microcebus murinus TaxID=30608 RepID=UPI00098AD366|nr:KHDC3-like protein [Microcebus murinus]
MATPKRFPTLVQLQQREGMLFEVLGSLNKIPYWFHHEFLKNPKAVRLESWLVEAIFGPDGEHIPDIECTSHILLHVNRWDPDGEAEILIFGRPYYQKDTAKLVMNLADHHRQLRAQGTGFLLARDLEGQETKTQQFPKAVREVRTQQSSEANREAGIQRSLVQVREAGTQWPPVKVREGGTHWTQV